MQLVREEVGHAGSREYLRQRRRVAEDIGKPAAAWPRAELLLEETDAVEQLSNQRLAGGDIAVGLDPHGPGGVPSPRFDPTAHFVVEGRVMRLRVGVELRL